MFFFQLIFYIIEIFEFVFFFKHWKNLQMVFLQCRDDEGCEKISHSPQTLNTQPMDPETWLNLRTCCSATFLSHAYSFMTGLMVTPIFITLLGFLFLNLVWFWYKGVQRLFIMPSSLPVTTQLRDFRFLSLDQDLNPLPPYEKHFPLSLDYSASSQALYCKFLRFRSRIFFNSDIVK